MCIYNNGIFIIMLLCDQMALIIITFIVSPSPSPTYIALQLLNWLVFHHGTSAVFCGQASALHLSSLYNNTHEISRA